MEISPHTFFRTNISIRWRNKHTAAAHHLFVHGRFQRCHMRPPGPSFTCSRDGPKSKMFRRTLPRGAGAVERWATQRWCYLTVASPPPGLHLLARATHAGSARHSTSGRAGSQSKCRPRSSSGDEVGQLLGHLKDRNVRCREKVTHAQRSSSAL